MANGLDLARRGVRYARRRRRRAAVLAVLCAAAVVYGGRLAAWAAALPAKADAALAEHFVPGYTRRLEALTEETRTLRAGYCALLPLREENDAWRMLTESPRMQEGAQYTPCTVTALGPQGFTVDAALAPGTALVDCDGRLLGVVRTSGERSAQAVAAGRDGCAAACAVYAADGSASVGTLERRGGTLWVTGLPRGCTARPGDAVVTVSSEACPAGCWVGTMAAAPATDESGLCAEAPLTGTAGDPAGVCFAVG